MPQNGGVYTHYNAFLTATRGQDLSQAQLSSAYHRTRRLKRMYPEPWQELDRQVRDHPHDPIPFNAAVGDRNHLGLWNIYRRHWPGLNTTEISEHWRRHDVPEHGSEEFVAALRHYWAQPRGTKHSQAVSNHLKPFLSKAGPEIPPRGHRSEPEERPPIPPRAPVNRPYTQVSLSPRPDRRVATAPPGPIGEPGRDSRRYKTPAPVQPYQGPIPVQRRTRTNYVPVAAPAAPPQIQIPVQQRTRTNYVPVAGWPARV